jgi:hypothetical protein
LAKRDMELSGDVDYWNGEIMSMKYLLLYIDKLLGKKNENNIQLPDLYEVFDRVDHKRKEKFNLLWSSFLKED